MADQPHDYKGNADKSKEPKEEKPKVERIVTGETKVVKPGLGRKIKGLITEADFKGTAHYVVHEVLIPAAQNMFVDAVTRGVYRVTYRGREGGFRSGMGMGGGMSRGYDQQKFMYNNPAAASGFRGVIPPRELQGPRNSRQYQDDIVIPSEAEAKQVLTVMNEIIDKYGFVSVGDFRDMCGRDSNHVDYTWGWVILGGVKVERIRDGWIIDLPPAESIR